MPPPPEPRAPDTGSGSEEFYARFWGTGFWSTAQPNPDECARAAKILALVERHRPPSRAGERLRILDVGCGRGWLTKLLADHGEVLGIDPVEAGVARARQLFPELSFRVADTVRLVADGGAAAWDVIVSSEVIEHVPDGAKPAYIRTIRELLVPGGLVVLTTPRGELRAWCAARGGAQQPVEDWVTEAALASLARGAGLDVIETDRAFAPHYPHSLGARIAGSAPFALLARSAPLAGLRRWRDRQGIYQIAALRRAAEA